MFFYKDILSKAGLLQQNRDNVNIINKVENSCITLNKFLSQTTSMSPGTSHFEFLAVKCQKQVSVKVYSDELIDNAFKEH